MGSVLHWVGFGLRALAPTVLTATLVLLSIVPWQLPLPNMAAPSVALMAVYYWGINRPVLLPPVIVFAIGLMQDTLGGDPIGLNALILLLAVAMVRRQRRFFLDKPFAVQWWGFMMVAAGAELVAWSVAAFLAGQVVDPAPSMYRLTLNILIYPILAWVFGLIGRGVPE